jgi:hypothetical protein
MKIQEQKKRVAFVTRVLAGRQRFCRTEAVFMRAAGRW